MADDPVYTLDPKAVEWRLVDDEVIALDLRTSGYVGLNATGAVLWQALADGATEAELIDQLVRRFQVEPGDARTDVRAFVDEMRERGLVG